MVRTALTEQLGRLDLAVARLTERQAPQVHMMVQRRERVALLLSSLHPGMTSYLLKNKEQVDRATDAVQGLIVKLWREQAKDYCDVKAAMIRTCGRLLDRIQIGWKKPAPIPPEVLEQIKAREEARFYNTKPGDWIVDDWYSWKTPSFDVVGPYDWIGI